MGALMKDDFSTMQSFVQNFFVLPEKLNVLHLYALEDHADNFE